MKLSKFVLILSFIGYCVSQDECATSFQNNLSSKCTSLNSCSYSYQECVPTKICESETDTSVCTNTIHPQFKKYKCDVDAAGKCASIQRECSAFNTPITVDGKPFNIDICSDLSAGEGKRCDFTITSTTACASQYNDCKSDLTGTDCTDNIPSDYSQKCVIDTTCKKETRKCIDGDISYISHVMTKEICEKLLPSDSTSGKGCFYTGGTCQEQYEKCSSYKGANPDTDCATLSPLKTDDGNAFTYLYKCSPNGDTCKSERKTCSDFLTIDSSSVCTSYLSTDNNKVCAYDYTASPPGCVEKYKTCSGFFTNAANKNKATCESYTPPTASKHCIWEGTSETEGVCKEAKVYLTCGEYTGNDKETCESIGTGNDCILDKDTTCKEKVIYCSDAANINECAKAKAKSDKKECIFTGGQCIENYKTCEDYVGNNMATCEGIIQFNGKKCVFDSTGCKPYNKICSEATSVEECLLIAKTGVTDPERRVCDYITGTGGAGASTFTCYENYKYCSDYRTIGSTIDSTTARTECERIKPYDSSGNNLDITSVCEYKTENNVGCQRKLADCSKAITATECESISAKLESTNFYCAFLGGQCKKYYKTCELFNEDSSHSSVSFSNCQDNIPKEYNTKYCKTEGGSCISKTKTCSTFLKNYEGTSLNTLCTEIGPFCSYSSPSCSKRNINTCSEITSTLITGLTEEICNAFQIGGNKICSLKADKSGCEEKEKPVIPVVQEPTLAPKTQTPEAIETATPEEISSTTAETETPQEQGSTSSSSGLKLFRIQIIMVVLSLLI